MANNRRGGRAKANQQSGVAALTKLLKQISIKNDNRKTRQRSAKQPYFPLASEEDLRKKFSAQDLSTFVSAVSTAIRQGAGDCQLSPSGKVSYNVEIGLPTRMTVKLIRLTENPTT